MSLSSIIASASVNQTIVNAELSQILDYGVPEESIAIAENAIAIDALFTTAENYQNLANVCFAAAKTGGFDASGVNALVDGVRGTGAVIGDTVAMPSGESFDEAGGRVDATMLSGEALVEKSKEILKAVKDFIMRQVKRLKDLWRNHMSRLGRMTKTIAASQTKYADVKGTASKAKIKLNLGQIFVGDKPATSSELSTNVTKFKNIEAMIKEVTTEANAVVAKMDSDAAGAITDIAGIKLKELTNKKPDAKMLAKLSMQSGYQSVSTESLVGEDVIAIGVGTEESSNGIKGQYLPGSVDSKKANAEFTTLTVSEITAYLKSAQEHAEVARGMVEAGDKYTEALDKVSDKVNKMADGLEGDAKEANKKLLSKIKDFVSFASKFVAGSVSHCTSVASASHNYAVKSASVYKESK